MQKQIHRPLTALVAVLILAFAFIPHVFAESGSVPQRSDIDNKYKWDLTTFFPNDQAWEDAYNNLEKNIPRIEQYKGTFSSSAKNLLDCLQLQDSLDLITNNLYVYANLKLDEDNRESNYQEMSGQISGLNSKLSSAEAFIAPEILKLDENQLKSYMNEQPDLKLYEFYLDNLMRSKKHILSEEQEALLAKAAPVEQAPAKIFTMLDDADMNYGTIKDDDGNDVELTKERYYLISETGSRELRRRANQAYNEAYLKLQNSLAATLASSVQKDYFVSQARKYNSCLDMAVDNDNIPPDVFHGLINAVDANLEPLHKWAALRKRILGYDTLYTYDLYVPLIPDFNKHFDYAEAEKMVLKGIAPLGKSYANDFQKGLNSGWIDVYETQGKGSGAYSWGTWSSHPVILLNYNGSLENVFTLAHEMGHAMHSYYTNANEPYVYSGHSIFTAEVASTCNEALLMNYLLNTTTDKRERMYLLNKYIEQIIGTFYTQVMFSEFEMAIHDRVEKGGALSADYMRKTYRDIYQKYWGPELVIDSINDLGELRISHFYRQFYVYQYATSYSAALAISDRILNKEPGALEAYQRFLHTGRSDYPVDILKEAGVDMTTPDPVNRTIKLFSRLVDEMEQLLNES